jgi:hypothetical protein
MTLSYTETNIIIEKLICNGGKGLGGVQSNVWDSTIQARPMLHPDTVHFKLQLAAFHNNKRLVACRRKIRLGLTV